MVSPSSSPLVWILAGEASGDVLGARLMHALRARVPNMRFAGVGGVRMQEEGLVSLFPMRDLAVMGLVEVLPRVRQLSARLDEATQDWPIKPVIVTDIHDKHDAFAAAGAALTKSGTSTLELALAGVPMAVTYRVNPITAFFARRLIKVPFVAMVNLLAGRAVVPELLQEQCRADVLAREVQILFENTDVAQAQKQAFATVLHGLEGPQGQLPAHAAAEAVLEVLNRKNTAKTLG